MRFAGRIRFDDVRSADLDVTVEVSDTHVRLVSGEESLGSWCLADVVANRLVANEFELDLAGQVIVFLADDQVNFAYGAVQKMAEGWARYHAMNLVRRKRAIATARRHNEPDRLAAVQRAFVSAREELQKPVETMVVPEPVAAPAEESPTAGPPEETPGVSPPGEATPEEDVTGEREEAPVSSGFWERVEQARAAEAEEPEPEDARPAITAANFAGRLPRLDAFPRRRSEPLSPPDDEAAAALAEGRGRHVAQPIAAESLQPETPAAAAVPEAVEEVAFVPESPPPEPQGPEVDNTEADDEATNGHRDGPSSLGSYRDGHHPSETSGLRASFRSLLTRSKEAHEHSFVESTTAVGITRRVCLECGHVSIGVSE